MPKPLRDKQRESKKPESPNVEEAVNNRTINYSAMKP